MVSCYFIGYSERSRGYKFYDPTSKTIFYMDNVHFFEDVEFRGEDMIRGLVFEKECVTILIISLDNDQTSIPYIV